jgi:hypothetical protein
VSAGLPSRWRELRPKSGFWCRPEHQGLFIAYTGPDPYQLALDIAEAGNPTVDGVLCWAWRRCYVQLCEAGMEPQCAMATMREAVDRANHGRLPSERIPIHCVEL